jgi:charged multivesicular body protein 1
MELMALSNPFTTSTPAADVDSLMKQVADEAGMDISEQLASVPGGMIGETAPAAATMDDPLSRRLAALRE